MNIEISGLIGMLALSLPLAALATLVALALRDARRGPLFGAPPRNHERATPGIGAPAPPAAAAPLETPPKRAGGAGETLAAMHRGAAEALPSAAPPRSLETPPVAVRENALDARFRAARALAAAGKSAEAAEALRGCLWEAGSQGRKDVQAEARLALGDVCLADGDTITACEHWQIARDFFHDLKRAADRDETDRRMKSNGCPTDWVLNDF